MHRSNESFFVSWFRSFVSSAIDMSTGLIGVITLGLVTPNWGMSYIMHCARKDMEQRKKELQVKSGEIK